MGAAQSISSINSAVAICDVDETERLKTCDFIVEFYYSDAPVLVKHNPDPQLPVFIRINPNITENLTVHEQHAISEGISYPTFVSVDVYGNAEIRFEKTNMTHILTVNEIRTCVQMSLQNYVYISYIPLPPIAITSTSTSIEIEWQLLEPPGIAKKIDIQYKIMSTPSLLNDKVLDKWSMLVNKRYEYPEFCHHIVEGLMPGTGVQFKLRYSNIFGDSEYSPPSATFWTLPDRPLSPPVLSSSSLHSNNVVISWDPAVDNGAPLLYYLLQGRSGGHDEFTVLYRGLRRNFLVMYLFPEYSYTFRVCAANSIGESEYSQKLTIMTPKGSSHSVQLDQTCRRDEDIERLSQERRDVWIECFDQHVRQEFYFNRLTGERFAERPTVLDRSTFSVDEGDAVEDEQEKQAKASRDAFRNKRNNLISTLRKGVSADAFKRDAYLVNINREQLLLDGYRGLMDASLADLRRRLKVDFINENGIDAGGLVKEFYLLLSRHAAMYAESPLRALLQHDARGGLGFSPLFLQEVEEICCSRRNTSSKVMETLLGELGKPSVEGLSHVKAETLAVFFGKLFAKALFDEQLVELPLSLCLAKHMLGLDIELDDLVDLDPDLHKSFAWMLENDITDILDDTFTVIDERTKKYVDLCADGGNRAVTEDNKVEYVKLRVAWLVKYSVHQLVDPFVNAFWNVIPLKILRECNISPTELVSLFRGSPSINIDDIRAYCVFQGSKSFNDQCEAVMTLWCVLREMREEHRRMFLAFVTGAARAPLDGFVPPFNLTEGRDMPEDSLPRAHTCFNQLVLPRYSSADMLRERLTFAIENCVGFELA